MQGGQQLNNKQRFELAMQSDQSSTKSRMFAMFCSCLLVVVVVVVIFKVDKFRRYPCFASHALCHSINPAPLPRCAQ